MEEFLNQFLDFVDKGTDWKENNETTNSQVINHFIANNDKLIRELVDKLCDGKEISDESGNCMKPDIMCSDIDYFECPDCHEIKAHVEGGGTFQQNGNDVDYFKNKCDGCGSEWVD